MQYRSFADMNQTILRHRNLLPGTIDLVVGIPRSGLVAANFLSLAINSPLTDLAGLIEGRIFEAGSTKRTPNFEQANAKDRVVVVIDDTIGSGRAFQAARRRIQEAKIPGKFIYCAIYGEFSRYEGVDHIFEVIGSPALCEWNVMHDRSILKSALVDFDTVLCQETHTNCALGNAHSIRSLDQSKPNHTPTRSIGTVVTSRPSAQKKCVERWLKEHGIEYNRLVLCPSQDLNLPAHVHKSKTYGSSDAVIFIGGGQKECSEIAQSTGKPVLSMEKQEIISPGLNLRSMSQSAKMVPIYCRNGWGGLAQGNLAVLKHRLRLALGERAYATLKSIFK